MTKTFPKLLQSQQQTAALDLCSGQFQQSLDELVTELQFVRDAAGRDVLITRSHPDVERGLSLSRIQVWDLETEAPRMTIPEYALAGVITDDVGRPLIAISPGGSPEIHLYEIPPRPVRNTDPFANRCGSAASVRLTCNFNCAPCGPSPG